MDLRPSTPSDMPSFDLALLGYDRRQVERCLTDLSARLAAAQTGLDATTVLQQQLLEAHLEIERLRAEQRATSQERQWGDRLEQVLTLAEEQAAELRAEAERDAERIRAEVFAESLQARRDLEAALRARQERDQRLDELLPTGAPEQPPAR